jgi:ABC-type multidrug transport system ATPase subunit
MGISAQRHAVEARELCKVYRRLWKSREIRALNHFSLQIRETTCLGLIGPAGAGKTTFVNILCSAIQADSGTIHLFGRPPGRDTVPRLCSFRDVSRNAALSSGDLLVIDESSEGAALVADQRLAEQIAKLRALGTTILVCSRSLAQVELICSEVAIVRAGQVVQRGLWDDLVDTGGFRLFVAAGLTEDLQARLTARGCAIGWSADTCWIESVNSMLREEVIEEVRSSGISLRSVEQLAPRLKRATVARP